jgi:hypothetical protein
MVLCQYARVADQDVSVGRAVVWPCRPSRWYESLREAPFYYVRDGQADAARAADNQHEFAVKAEFFKVHGESCGMVGRSTT